MNRILIALCVVLIVFGGVFLGFIIYSGNVIVEENNSGITNNVLVIEEGNNIVVSEILAEEERTTPNTLIVYKTYYTKCKHYIQKYEDVDVTMVNLTEKEFKEKMREWRIDKFSMEEVELSKEIEAYCNEHYKLKLENNVIVVYKIDEVGNEKEYEQTGITTEYLTNEDILKLKTGIEVYGDENLSSAMEDYE